MALPDSNKWRPGEKYIMEHATYIKDYEGLKLYSFHWEKCWNEEKAWKDSVHQHASSKVPQINIVVDHMDQQENTNAFFGKGCLNIQHHDSLVLYDGPLHLQIGSNCEFSLWARVNEKDYRMPSVYLNFYDSSQKLVNRVQIWSAHDVNNSMQFWFRIYNQFVMQPNYHRLKIIFSNPDKKSASLVDELQVRTLSDTTCFRGNQGVLFNNNLLIK